MRLSSNPRVNFGLGSLRGAPRPSPSLRLSRILSPPHSLPTPFSPHPLLSRPPRIPLPTPLQALESPDNESIPIIVQAQRVIDFLDTLNDEQTRAATSTDPYMRVLAGPGSGKTRVMIARIADLIVNRGVKPYRIVAITFTNRAAGEVYQRLADLLGTKIANKVRVRTFHSYCAWLLRKWLPNQASEQDEPGLTQSYTILDESETSGLLRAIVVEAKMGPNAMIKLDRQEVTKLLDPLETWFAQIYAKEPFAFRLSGRAAASLIEFPTWSPINSRHFAAMWDKLHATFLSLNAISFDGIQSYATSLLYEFPQLRAELQDSVSHLLIDEFQDSDQMQMMLVRLMCIPWNNQAALEASMSPLALSAVRPSQQTALPTSPPKTLPNLFVVGDINQSIYGFRGANVDNIKTNIRLMFPTLSTYSLKKNYRSIPPIVRSSGSLIKRNYVDEKDEDAMDAIRYEAVRQEEIPPIVLIGEDERREAELVAEHFFHLRDRHKVAWKDMAVLVRTRVQLDVFAHVFHARGLPHLVLGGYEFWKRKEVVDVLAYVQILLDPRGKEVALRRVINKPSRDIGDKAIETLGKYLAWRDGAKGDEDVRLSGMFPFNLALDGSDGTPPDLLQSLQAACATFAAQDDASHWPSLRINRDPAPLDDQVVHDVSLDMLDPASHHVALLLHLQGIVHRHLGPFSVQKESGFKLTTKALDSVTHFRDTIYALRAMYLFYEPLARPNDGENGRRIAFSVIIRLLLHQAGFIESWKKSEMRQQASDKDAKDKLSVGLDRWVQLCDESDTMFLEQQLERWKEMEEEEEESSGSSVNLVSPSSRLHILSQVMGNIALTTDSASQSLSLNQDKVIISTIHRAKGLEWAAVAVAGCTQKVLPFTRSNGDSDYDEERRLYFVAITRAKTHLLCTLPAKWSWPAMRYYNEDDFEPSKPSSFLFESQLATRAELALAMDTALGLDKQQKPKPSTWSNNNNKNNKEKQQWKGGAGWTSTKAKKPSTWDDASQINPYH